MNIRCKCGSLILDDSDFISYKGYVVPDHDLEDIENEIVADVRADATIIYKYSKSLYQCTECFRLILETNDELHFFSADTPESSRNLLRSVLGEKWKRNLRGSWSNNKGTLWWGFGVSDEQYDSDIKSWEELSKRYFEAFERLEKENILRDSFLCKDGVMIHTWEPKKRQTTK